MRVKVAYLLSALAFMLVAFCFGMSHEVMANINDKACSEISDDTLKEAMGCNSGDKTVQPIAVNLINAGIATVGIIAVVVIVISGIRLATSSGDASKIAQARRMIIYALVGLGVAVFAWTIVTFVLDNFASE